MRRIVDPPTQTPNEDGTVPPPPSSESLPAGIPVLRLFSQPVGLEQMLQHALSLTEYSTFSAVMRAKAAEVAKRKAWERSAVERRERADAIRESLESPSAEELKAAWSDLRSRTIALVRPATDGEDDAANLPPDLREVIQRTDDRFAELSELGALRDWDDDQKTELFLLLAGPFLRLLSFTPSAARTVNEDLPKLQALIAAGE